MITYIYTLLWSNFVSINSNFSIFIYNFSHFCYRHEIDLILEGRCYSLLYLWPPLIYFCFPPFCINSIGRDLNKKIKFHYWLLSIHLIDFITKEFSMLKQTIYNILYFIFVKTDKNSAEFYDQLLAHNVFTKCFDFYLWFFCHLAIYSRFVFLEIFLISTWHFVCIYWPPLHRFVDKI